MDTSPTGKIRTIRSITALARSHLSKPAVNSCSRTQHVLHHKAEGPALIIDNPSSRRFAETGVECSTWHVELSCTQHDELALKRVDSGTGMIGLLIPIHSRSSTLGLSRRTSAETKPDDLR